MIFESLPFISIDILGYLASFFVAISFLFKELKTVRWFNLVGCGLFVGYGISIGNVPIIITNVFICLVQIYYLFIKK